MFARRNLQHKLIAGQLSITQLKPAAVHFPFDHWRKQHWAGIAHGWETAWELLVLMMLRGY